MKLKDKVVFITDAAVETGVEIAARFGEEGAVLALNIFPPDCPCSAGKYGMITHADPGSKEEIDRAVQSVLDKFGRIDVLVHNNNEIAPALLEDCTDETFDKIINTNLRSAFFYAQAAGPSMKKAGKGSFVFVSSIHDEKPAGAAFPYSISKGALKMLAREMVLDMGPYNIRTNIVNAGPVEGDEQRFYSDLSTLYEFTRERIVNHSYCTPGEIANAALFFAEETCPSANGSELRLDGGFLLSYFRVKVDRDAAMKAKPAWKRES